MRIQWTRRLRFCPLLDTFAGAPLMRGVDEEALRMSTVVTTGAVVLVLALLAMLVFSRWRIRTIAIMLVGVAVYYVYAFLEAHH